MTYPNTFGAQNGPIALSQLDTNFNWAVDIQNQALAAVATGSSDAITATFTPAVASLVAGLKLYVRAGLANVTTTPQFSPNGLTARNIVKLNNQTIVAGDITGAGHWLQLVYDATLTVWVLQNPGIATTLSGGAVNATTLNASGAVTLSNGLAVTGALSATGTLSGGTSGTGYSLSGSAPAGSLTLDASGNIGIGVTPSSWGSYKALEMQSFAITSDVNTSYHTNNVFYLSGYRYLASKSALKVEYDASLGQIRWYTAPSGTAGNTITFTQVMTLDGSGNLTPGGNGTQAFGSTSLRWSQVWCTAGAFNTSDARLKTAVTPFNPSEITAATALAREIGTWQWLSAVEEKGDKARLHTSLTVQRAIEIMTANGLDWTRYGFVGYDKWDDKFTEHSAIEAVAEVLDADGKVTTPAVEAKEAWSEKTQKAGDCYSFRYDELAMFVARGQSARQDALEARITALEAK